MGMFDEVQIDYPLPWPEVQDIVWQSKDTPDQHCTRYVIATGGQLCETYGPAGELVFAELTLDGAIECYTSHDGWLYSVTFWFRDGVVKDTIFEKRNIRSEP